ncbi:MAG: hypothetical protein H6Q74_2960 [Firmicutes bacterium]|nr:hypothetical protein [Bacillota bacterium]
MFKFTLALVFSVILCWSRPSEAADVKFDISLARLNDGTVCGELIRNNQVVWRVVIFSDGVRAVAGNIDANTIIVVPDIVDGLFLLKVYNQ